MPSEQKVLIKQRLNNTIRTALSDGRDPSKRMNAEWDRIISLVTFGNKVFKESGKLLINFINFLPNWWIAAYFSAALWFFDIFLKKIKHNFFMLKDTTYSH